jgi:ATP-independent RNA helicase DbpA
MQKFSDVTALSPALLQAVDVLGYSAMTPIQAAALPVLTQGMDILAQAKTGSGKTAAFALAALTRLQPELSRLQVLVLCPTRELADQVSKEFRALARFIPNVKVLSLCGGISIHPQLASLTHEPHIVVGTPGRLLDLLGRDALKPAHIHTVILDEADRMLDMGFLDDVSKILEQTPASRSTWLFSATYPPEIRALSQQFQREPASVSVMDADAPNLIEQRFYKVDMTDKPAAVLRLLLQQQADSTLVFCNTKVDTANLTDFLWKQGVPAISLHGDLDQREREETLVQFANGSKRVLVATDVAARGLDIKALPLVIAYELPNDSDVHTHRIGRTGRAGEQGLALTLVGDNETSRVQRVEAMLHQRIEWSALPNAAARKLPAPAMRTLIIDAGRQDKLRPGDIVGALTGVGGLHADQVGKIDVFATRSYVAVAAAEIDKVIDKLRAGKIKGRNFRLRKLR